MRVEVKFIHLVVIFVKVISVNRMGKFSSRKRFLPSDYCYIHSGFKGFYGISDCLKVLRMSNACARGLKFWIRK